jgi:CBS domain-containing protein
VSGGHGASSGYGSTRGYGGGGASQDVGDYQQEGFRGNVQRGYGAVREERFQERGDYPERGREGNYPIDARAGGWTGAAGRGAVGRGGYGAGEAARSDFATERGFERDMSAEVGLGYRDYGEGRGTARGAGGETARRTRWHREPGTARDIMTKNPRSVTRNASLQEVARIMRDEDTGVVPVVEEGGTLLGLITDRDIVIRTLAEGRNPLEVRAADVMTDDVEAVTPDESLREVVELMGGRQIRRVPVVDQNDRLVGIISMGDVAKRADYDEELQEALEDISARRSFWNRIFG